METGKRAKRVTISDVAKKCGVSMATVSYVLNANNSKVSISERTRRKVIRAANECGYHPSAAARALATQRTGQLGMILADNAPGGWTNLHFAGCLGGVEKACRERNYGLNVSLYNLSNIDTFVFPASVGQRSVDGVILTGFIETAVVRRFSEFGVPCICIGDDLEVAELMTTVACDAVGGTVSAIRHLANLGHRRIAYQSEPTRRGMEIVEIVRQRCAEDGDMRDCELVDFTSPAGYVDAGRLLGEWLALPKGARPTAILSFEYFLLSLQRELRLQGLECPRDISLVSSGDPLVCMLSDPKLTALRQDFDKVGRVAVNMLVDSIENGTELTPDMSQNDCLNELIVRDSCGPAHC